MAYPDTGETGDIYDAEIFVERVEPGARVAVVKIGDPYSGRLGEVLSMAVSDTGLETVCNIDFGDSDVRGFSVRDLIRMPSPEVETSRWLAAALSPPRKDPMQCQEWNSTCLYDGYRFCPNGCGLWLCTHHFEKHEAMCPSSPGLDIISGTMLGI